MQRYDIFNKHNNICITNDCFLDKESTQRIVIECDKDNVNSINFTQFFTDTFKKNVTIIVKNLDFEETFKKITKKLIFVPAAGGVVKNEKGEYLFIFRNKHLDLPKGHQEEGEELEVTAVREVEEETGLQDITLGEKLGVTYHTYKREGKRELKVTHWYSMQSNSEEKLIPQQEEGIEKVEWLSEEYISEHKKNIYPSLYHFLKKVMKI
jgi:8-oxo-dGTP pyrophosphatase MutT (NUDIX family)